MMFFRSARLTNPDFDTQTPASGELLLLQTSPLNARGFMFSSSGRTLSAQRGQRFYFVFPGFLFVDLIRFFFLGGGEGQTDSLERPRYTAGPCALRASGKSTPGSVPRLSHTAVSTLAV